ncbi:hypothetical protein HK405_014589 [Cladochytrium tenue]|nr:hypothetical protein HK405_014589 [Cladochytrium tenue]
MTAPAPNDATTRLDGLASTPLPLQADGSAGGASATFPAASGDDGGGGGSGSNINGTGGGTAMFRRWVDQELAERNQAEIERLQQQHQHQLQQQPPSHAPIIQPFFSTDSSSPDSVPAIVPPPSVAPAGGPSLLLREKPIHESIADDLEFLRLSGLSLNSHLAGRRDRPGAPAEEEMELCKAYFTKLYNPGFFVHMRSFFKSFNSIDPLLRTSVCAAGAILKESESLDRIKPLCSEELWWSLEDPDALDAAYKLSKVDDNISSYYGPLFELIFEIVYLYQPEVIASLQGNIHKKEHDLDRRVNAWLESLPPKYWVPFNEEWMLSALKRQDPKLLQRIWLMLLFYGTLCMLMRRQGVEYLKKISQCPSEYNPEQDDPPITEMGSMDGVSSVLKLEVAFNTGVDMAMAMSRYLGTLLKSGLGANLLPRFTVYFCVQGALTAVMSRGFVRNSTSSLLMVASELSDDTYEQAISNYFRFLTTITNTHGAGSDVAGGGSVLLRFLDALHRDDWPALDAITAVPDAFLSRLPDGSNNPSDDFVRPSMPPPARIAAFSASLRDLVDAVRVARLRLAARDAAVASAAPTSDLPSLTTAAGTPDDLGISAPLFVAGGVPSTTPRSAAAAAAAAADLLPSSVPAPDPAHTHILMDWLFTIGTEDGSMIIT